MLPCIDLPSETWRPIPGYQGRYDVSDHCRVRSWVGAARRGGVPKRLIPSPLPERVTFCVGHRRTYARVSDLVAAAFPGLPVGAPAGRGRLTPADVLTIRYERARGTSGADLARRYGVTEQAISLAARGLTWRHLPLQVA